MAGGIEKRLGPEDQGLDPSLSPQAFRAGSLKVTGDEGRAVVCPPPDGKVGIVISIGPVLVRKGKKTQGTAAFVP
jgi:hypothetical protein